MNAHSPDSRPAPVSAPTSSRAGFTLMELLVAMAMFTIVLVGALLLLDATNRVTRTQLGRANIQQAVRVAQDDMLRISRTAGRGGLKSLERSQTPAEASDPDKTVFMSVETMNNVGTGTRVLPSDASSPEVAEGSDVLIVRGTFDSTIYYGDFNDPSSYEVNVTDSDGWVDIEPFTKVNRFEQDLTYLQEQAAEAVPVPEAVILVSPFDEDTYGVAEVDWDSSRMVDGNFRLEFRFTDDGTMNPLMPSSRLEAYSALSSDPSRAPDDFVTLFPAATLERSGIKAIALLQEYRYFIRDDEVNGRKVYSLARTRSLPNWDQLWTREAAPAPEDYYEDISDYVIDLQVAMGFSNDDPASPTQGLITDTGDNLDQWFGNAASDNQLPDGDLEVLRISALARSSLVERNYEAQPILGLEDRTYSATDLNSPDERRHHRFFLQTVVQLRNL